MQVMSNGRIKRSASEWRAIIERCEASGLSHVGFCRQEKIAKASFDKWKRQLSRAGQANPSTFVELSLPSESRPSLSAQEPSAIEFELSLPGGVVLRWKS